MLSSKISRQQKEIRMLISSWNKVRWYWLLHLVLLNYINMPYMSTIVTVQQKHMRKLQNPAEQIKKQSKRRLSRNLFRIKTMFGSSSPPVVCRRAPVLFTLFLSVNSGVQYILCCVSVLLDFFLCHVSNVQCVYELSILDCPFGIL